MTFDLYPFPVFGAATRVSDGGCRSDGRSHEIGSDVDWLCSYIACLAAAPQHATSLFHSCVPWFRGSVAIWLIPRMLQCDIDCIPWKAFPNPCLSTSNFTPSALGNLAAPIVLLPHPNGLYQLAILHQADQITTSCEKTTVELGTTSHSINIIKIPYPSFQGHPGQDTANPTHRDIPLFDVAYCGIDIGFRHCFRKLAHRSTASSIFSARTFSQARASSRDADPTSRNMGWNTGVIST